MPTATITTPYNNVSKGENGPVECTGGFHATTASAGYDLFETPPTGYYPKAVSPVASNETPIFDRHGQHKDPEA
jgi:hypothetical protein